jgi:hypothetical protein
MDLEATGGKRKNAIIRVRRMERKSISQFKDLQRENQKMA